MYSSGCIVKPAHDCSGINYQGVAGSFSNGRSDQIHRFEDPVKYHGVQNGAMSYISNGGAQMPILSEVTRNSMSTSCNAGWEDSRSSCIPRPDIYGAQQHESFPAASSGTLASSWGPDASPLLDIIPKAAEAICLPKSSEGMEDEAGGSEQMVLEHYRFAVFELTRQNLLLRRQLAAAEERLAKEDGAVDIRSHAQIGDSKWVGNDVSRHDMLQQNSSSEDSSASMSWPMSGVAAKGAPRKIAQARFWSKVEHARFLEGVKRFGSQDAHSIAAHVGTRTVTQVRTHAQKYFLKLAKAQAEGASDSAAQQQSAGDDGSDEDGSDS
jgi:SHAQKYF class myb-like DNA-binding protein